MKICWHSPPLWYFTGYGVQSHYFTKVLQALGHEVRLATNCVLTFSPILTYDGVPHYPTGLSVMGKEGVLTMCKEWHPDMVISLCDVWVLPEDFGMEIERAGGGGWYPYAPIDHDPPMKEVLDRLVLSKMPLAMSKFAAKKMTENGMQPWYLPHCTDTSIYKPLIHSNPVFEKEKFVVGMVAANMSIRNDRKGFVPAIRTFAKFEKNHPDALLYVHTNPFKIPGESQDLFKLAIACGTTFARPDPRGLELGIAPQELCEIYNGFDVLLMPSKGEGFGIPLIEAQACGVPVITTDFSATAELGGNGWLIPPKNLEWSGGDSWMANPDEDAILDALEEAYEMKHSQPDKWVDKKMAAHEFAQQYDVNSVAEKYLVPLLDAVRKAPVKASPAPKKSRKKHK